MHISKICLMPFLTPKKCNFLRNIPVLTPKRSLSVQEKVSADNYKERKYTWINPRRWYIPFGIGFSFFSIYAWRQFQRKPEEKAIARDIVIECYCHLPLRITSRVWGWIASVELPNKLRPTLYKFYAKTFGANLEEIDLDLSSFPSLVDFFVRPLKKDARPIAENTNIVSPSDGTILHIGPVTNCFVEQVKGVTYDLRHFLGDRIDVNSSDDTKAKSDYISSLLKNPDNQLYQFSVYLAPGDYHRFHSPTDWKINLRRHFQGKLLSVNPKISSWVPDLFSLNERAIYIGEWSAGFMAYAVVGATNVGSIRVFRDEHLITNGKKWPKGKNCEEKKFQDLGIKKGELFGEFRMGSTIVLLFEAPKDFRFCLKDGGIIKVGEGLADCFIEK
ncbi:phosphatidylserine decarboxylase proenzyme, mitochondrial [Belonocnema kinseyi]|uniref:phosphatidylserine decarboxylase proenzyme, mitochondrial n=1 Tax=Belonocnema kinseyi TaxID=2817044 RepID=UPI00143D1A7C|nr:phosphatidylserine decarboxylase proenzyme, mitochondrial [Belonocnema kinseyi]